jgi:hypothetical protein
MAEPQAAPNWTTLLWEYAVVVLGVLTALIVDQAAEDWNWHQRKVAALAAMEADMVGDTAVQLYWRASIEQCLDQRFAKLAKSVIAGSPEQIAADSARIAYPNRGYNAESFDSAIATGLVDHIEVDRWSALRSLFGSVSNLDARATAERPLLASIRAYDPDLGPPDAVTKRDMLRSIAQLRELNQNLNQTGRWVLDLLDANGVELGGPAMDSELAQVRPRFAECWAPPVRRRQDLSPWTYKDIFTP